MRVRIEGHELPGRDCAPADAGRRYENVHVGVQRALEVVELVAGDAAAVRWDLDVRVRPTDDGTLDLGGPFVHGRRGDRFLYLSWGTVDDAGAFTMFRRAKLQVTPGGARVRAPDVTWTTEKRRLIIRSVDV